MQAVPLPRCTYLSQHRLWFCDRLSRRDWFDADENNINKKADTPKLWGREKTYLGENSFSSRYFNSLWALLLSDMQAESNTFVIGFGVEKEVVCVLPIGEGSWQLLKGLVPNQQWRTERFLPQGPSSTPSLRKGPGGLRPKSSPGFSTFLLSDLQVPRLACLHVSYWLWQENGKLSLQGS